MKNPYQYGGREDVNIAPHVDFIFAPITTPQKPFRQFGGTRSRSQTSRKHVWKQLCDKLVFSTGKNPKNFSKGVWRKNPILFRKKFLICTGSDRENCPHARGPNDKKSKSSRSISPTCICTRLCDKSTYGFLTRYLSSFSHTHDHMPSSLRPRKYSSASLRISRNKSSGIS